jgi:hypothetical protein
MVLFLQFDVQADFGLPFQTGSHLSVFMCPRHNDAPEMFSDLQLPAAYWERRLRIDGTIRFYELFLHRAGVAAHIQAADEHLLPQQIEFELTQEVADNQKIPLLMHPQFPGVSLSIDETVGGLQGLKVGGQPSWAQGPEVHRCSCGAAMRFLCQIPENWPFPKLPKAPKQADSFSADDYCLFLGNEVYLFACEAQCDPRAVHVVVQN